MSARRAVAPPWATDDSYATHDFHQESTAKATSRRYTSNVPSSSGVPGDFQTWATGAHDKDVSSWTLRNRPLPEVYGSLDKKILMPDEECHQNDTTKQYLFRKKTPTYDSNPYEGVLGNSILPIGC